MRSRLYSSIDDCKTGASINVELEVWIADIKIWIVICTIVRSCCFAMLHVCSLLVRTLLTCLCFRVVFGSWVHTVFLWQRLWPWSWPVTEKSAGKVACLVSDIFYLVTKETINIIIPHLKSAYSLDSVPSLRAGKTFQNSSSCIDFSLKEINVDLILRVSWISFRIEFIQICWNIRHDNNRHDAMLII